MGDGLKLSRDKRHRSSSSLAGVVLEGTRSERKLEIRGSIPEGDDQFALADSRCDNLQEKLDLVKILKRKRKLKKRSMTRVTDQQPVPESVPFISVRTQPKTKVSQQAARLRRLEPPNPARGYLDPATLEQHRMIGQVRGYNQMYKQPQPQDQAKCFHDSTYLSSDATRPNRTSAFNKPVSTDSHYSRTRPRRARADGDSMRGQGVQINSDAPLEVACGDDDDIGEYSDDEIYEQQQNELPMRNKKPVEVRLQAKQPVSRRRHVPRDLPPKEVDDTHGRGSAPNQPYRNRQYNPRHQQYNAQAPSQTEERPVVELFNKNRASLSPDTKRQTLCTKAQSDKRTKKVPDLHIYDEVTGPLGEVTPAESKKTEHRYPRRMKYRSRRYEQPTVASQMKQAGMRYYYGNYNHTNIPFVVSKSTAPSHNIGVNIQQVLNGLKIQQPLSGIPLTIAHHMGLGHVPTYGTKSATMQPSLDNREINAIKLGRRLLRLPSYKYMSYNRLLSLYREGDGMVPRFLKAISRPHYFYTSMYNLATNREDFDGATSKGRGGSHEAKQSLAEYASLYREYEHIDKCIKDGNFEPDMERRKEELSRELAAREEHIHRVVQEYRTSAEVDQTTLRASASTAEEGLRHSAFRLNMGETQ